MVVIQGPRFSTRSESRWFSSMGWGVINMTAYPEGWLARELELCYANVSLITDYDVGLEDDPDVEPVSHEAVVKVFTENNERLRELLFAAIPKIGAQPARHLRDRAHGGALLVPAWRPAVARHERPGNRLVVPRPLLQSRRLSFRPCLRSSCREFPR